MVTIVRGTTNKPISSQQLASFFVNHSQYSGILYIGYPIIGTAEGPFPIDALLISKGIGLVVFNLVEGRDADDIHSAQDDNYNKLESKLRAHKSLMHGRILQVPICPVTFAPARELLVQNSSIDYPVCNEKSLEECLKHFLEQPWKDARHFEDLVAVIQAISTIRKGMKKRTAQRPDSRGAKLKFLEDSIANLDNQQGKAVIETVDGVQRIRGLAGSGKTIVLALKAAYLHAQHPDWKIAVTFQSRSLKDQFRRLINTFSIEQTNEEPDWDNIQIIHAWGAPGGGDRNGIYYSFCQSHGLDYYDFGSARKKFGRGQEFAVACQQALDQCGRPIDIYDAILIDEAQDLPPAFLRLCFEMLKKSKRLVYAYDELQNLNNQSLPPAMEIFGKNPNGSPRVCFDQKQPGKPQQDVMLKKCYRNSRPLLATAHALGFGIYRTPAWHGEQGLIQMFDHHKLWDDVGYQVSAGTLEDGQEVTLSRNENSSPAFLEDHSPIDDLVHFQKFSTKEEQMTWVANAIKVNLTHDELDADDIVVINPNPLTTRDAVGPIRKMLYALNINSHLAGVDTTPDTFYRGRESVTFTGIHRAKGNEAGMVYIINADDCFENSATKRNRLFTAITRSKAWVRVLGVGQRMASLMGEFEKLKDNNFSLSFRYPTESERKHLHIVNRDMTESERRAVSEGGSEVSSLLSKLEAGQIYPEDLKGSELKRLQAILNNVK